MDIITRGMIFMKKMIVAMMFIAVTSSMSAMYEEVPSEKKLLDFEQKRNDAIRVFLSSPVKTSPKELLDVAAKYAYDEVIQEIDLIHSRDENGWNVAHHLAAKGAKYGEGSLEFVLEKCRVSPWGVTLSDGTQSPSLDDVMKAFDNGEYKNYPEVALAESSAVRKLDFDEEVEPVNDEELVEEPVEEVEFVNDEEAVVESAALIKEATVADKVPVVAECNKQSENEDVNRPNVMPIVEDIHSAQGLEDKSEIGKEESSLVRYTFWAVVGVIAAGLLYKKYGTFDNRKQGVSLIPGK